MAGSGQIWPTLGHNFARSGQPFDEIDHLAPELAEFWPTFAQLVEKNAQIGQVWRNRGQASALRTIVRQRSESVPATFGTQLGARRALPSGTCVEQLAKLNPLCHNWPLRWRDRQNTGAKSGPILTKMGQIWPNSSDSAPNFRQNWPNLRPAHDIYPRSQGDPKSQSPNRSRSLIHDKLFRNVS